jgi:type 1 glutamine amidotransferase
MAAQARTVVAALVAGVLSLPALLVASAIAGPAAGAGPRDPTRVLVFTRTTGYRHASIEPAVAAIEELGRQHDFEVTATEDPAVFADGTVRDHDAVVFLSTTGNPVAEPAQRRALRRYVERGGGFVGVHAASDQDEESRASWPWFGRLLGAYFGGHPLYDARPTGDESCATAGVVSCHTGVVRFEDRKHPATREVIRDNAVLGATGAPRRFWDVYDEFYGFDSNPRDRVHVLATLDEKTYLDDPLLRDDLDTGEMGRDHPIAWCHPVGRGRSFYTGLGHDASLFEDVRYLDHLVGGILWAAGRESGDCRP